MKKTNKVELIVLKKGLTYEQALNALLEDGAIITRPEWEGYHFRYFENYGIRLANGEVIMNPEEVFDTDKKDWMVVDIKDEKEIEVVYKKIVEILEKEK